MPKKTVSVVYLSVLALAVEILDLEISFLVLMYVFRTSSQGHVSRSFGQGQGHCVIRA